jgi:hypothetical protein
VRELLKADSSHLVGKDLDLEASAFAASLDIQLMTLKHLENLETSLDLNGTVWPCRSDFQWYDELKRQISGISKDKNDSRSRYIKACMTFIEIESWISFRYSNLNKLFRLAEDLPKLCDSGAANDEQELNCRYIFSALMVRFCQFLLAICLSPSRNGCSLVKISRFQLSSSLHT